MPTPERTPAATPWLAYLCLGASMALVGSYVGLSKLLLAVFPVFLLAWLRFAIAAPAMLHWLRREPWEAPTTRSERRLLFLQSLFGNVLFSVCMLFGVLHTSALAAGVVMAAIPAAVALLSRLWLGEPLTPRVLLAIACAAAGIALLALAAPAAAAAGALAAPPWWGWALLLAAVFCEATYVVIGKRLSGRVSPRRISALINLWGLALITPLGLWYALGFDFTAVAAPTWALLVFYALAASMVAVWLWMQGLRRVPAAQAGVFTVWLPVGAAAVGIGVLGEPFGALHGLALALAIAGVVLATGAGGAQRRAAWP
jgi:drug/metabolite transporter (DMT)-like permease